MPFRKESPQPPELTLELASAYAQSFIYRHDCYPIQLDKGNYVSLKKPLQPQMVLAHLKGLVTLGAYALDSQSIAHWLCLDADQAQAWEAVKTLAHKLAREGIHGYLELSRRGGHYWLFTPPLSGANIRRFGKALLAKYGLSKLEVYPKQDSLKTGVGSLVRLPLGVHRITGKRYPFISLDDEPLAATMREQIALLAQPRKVPQNYIDHVLAEAHSPTPSIKESFPKVHQRDSETLSKRIKASISVFEFVSRYVELDALGKGYCPFHDDQHKSFGVHPDRNFWHCYAGCGGGSVIDFWMKWREKHGKDPSFKESIKEMAEMLFG